LKAAGPEGQQAIEAATAQPGMGAPSGGELVENSRPTTAQVAPTPGLVEMEKAARVNGGKEGAAAFNARAVEQNNARVGAIRNLAPEEAEPALLGQHFTQMLQDIDARHAGEATAGREALTQQGEQAAAQARGAVQGATQAVGGTTAPDVTGEAIRGSLMERNKAAKAAESSLWQAVDPNNKLNMPLSETQVAAKSILETLDPRLGDSLGPAETTILNGAAKLPDVTSFQNIGRLWSNVSRAIRDARGQPGSDQTIRRLTMLKISLSNDIENGVSASAASDQAMAARIKAFQAKEASQRAAVANEIGQQEAMYGPVAGEAGGFGDGGRSGAREGGLPPAPGSMGEERGRPANPARDSAVALAEPVPGAASRVTPLPELAADQNLRPNIDAGLQGRYAAARNATLERKQTFGQGPVGAVLRPGRGGAEFNVEHAAIARQFLSGNSTEPARVQKFIDAVGGEPQAVAAMQDALVADLRQRRIVDEDGMVKADRLKAWLQPEARGRTVDLFPGLREQLGTAEAAQRAYDQTIAEHATRLDAFNKQAAADHIAEVGAFKKTGGQFATAEPLDALKRLFASKNRTNDFAAVVEQAKGNPEVLDGLKRLTADYIEQRFSSARPSGENTDFLKSNEFRKWIDERRDPLKVIFGGQGLQNLEMVAADLRRQAMATATPATPGSDTAQKLSVMRKDHGSDFQPTAMAILSEQGGDVVSHILGAHEGVFGKLLGFGAGVGTLLLHTMKQAGISTKNDLIREAMLNPAVARELMTRASANNQISAMSQRRIARAIQASIVNNAIGQSNQEPKQ